MNKNLIALCLSAGLLTSAPGISLVDVDCVSQNTSDAPTVPSAALQQLTWTPVDRSKTQATQLSVGGQQLNAPGISGPATAYSVPTSIGELTLALTSKVNRQTSISAPNVLIPDQNMVPSAFFSSSCLTYQEPGVMSTNRLKGAMRLTPAPGQQKLYVLVSTMERDLQQMTQLLDPAKAYAKGAGNSIPNIPDPVARHTTDGSLKLKVKTNSNPSVLVGPLFGFSASAPVMVGNTATPTMATPVPIPVRRDESMLNDTESCFNTAIESAAAEGDIDKALRLFDEAEHLGSTSARSIFISSVEGKG